MDELKNRKATRLKGANYHRNQIVFLTICTKERQCLLSRIVGTGVPDGPQIELTKYGQIADKYIKQLSNFYNELSVERYVIMPNHIHIIMILEEDAGASPRPTIMDIVCAYKSLTTRECRKNGFQEKLFQTSFFEHIIRNRQDYEEHMKYIYENPMRWYYDELYTEE